jgi:[ribosomal protein S18]-alanine N-acetyltransferase
MRDETSKCIRSSKIRDGSFLAGKFIITPATGVEAVELFALSTLCEQHPWSEKNVASALADTSAFHFLLRRAVDGALCSFVLARFIIDELEIDKVGTHPDFRRQGCARLLLRHSLHEAKKRGGKRALLEVRAGNNAAQACYGSIGFHVDSVRKGYYHSQEDALLMSIAL